MTHDPSKTPEPNQPQADAATEEEITPIQPTSAEPDAIDAARSEIQSAELASDSAAAEPEQAASETAVTEVNEAVALSEQAEADQALPSVETQVPAEAIPTGAQTSPPLPEQLEQPETEPISDRPLAASTPVAAPSQQASTTPAASAPTPSQPGAATNQFQSFLQAMRRLGGVLWTIWLAVSPVLVGIAKGIWQLTLSLLRGIQQGWNAALPRIKRLLPEGWNKLPDWFLTTIAIALLVFVSWVSILLLPNPSPSVEPAETQPPSAVSPQPAPAAPDPELIADIQTQVAEVTDRYAEGLIQSVQANFRLSQLIVQVGDGWYGLTPGQQDQLTSELLRRSRKLEFNDLAVTNSAGDLLARNPVVGSKMVIYERS
ncbi:MAG: hypothetical protein Kow00121_53760 [Elainellaceae cyanobacterium]